ncbi:hypothetical protein AC481_07140 [miscellaneous Crenarchaeota group archaeon SMTZ-80]|nr:MAG: hypothetical protein AC481_07140 [miscellaneous Crenarchaeota group archaeon SMTZ-80]
MELRKKKIIENIKRIISSRTLIFILPFLLPLLLIFMVNPELFILGWNEGQGSMTFIVLFILIEWLDSRNKLELKKSRKSVIARLILIFAMLFYFTFLYTFGYHTIIASLGKMINVPGDLSWTRMWDFVIYTFFVISMISFSFNGPRDLKYFPTPIVYAIGMASILLLDSVLPHSQLGIFEGVVSIIVFLVVSMLGYFGVRINIIDEQTLLIWGKKGTLKVSLYWPCVGILSMLIYFLVIIILMIKLDIPIYRKIMYTIIGAVGTFFINVIRIFLIIYYGAFINVNLRLFHETIGEVLFIIWIVIFILAVTEWESFKRKRKYKSEKKVINLKTHT